MTTWTPRPARATSWRTEPPGRLDRALAVLNHPAAVALVHVALFIALGLASDWSFAALLLGCVIVGQVVGRMVRGRGRRRGGPRTDARSDAPSSDQSFEA